MLARAQNSLDPALVTNMNKSLIRVKKIRRSELWCQRYPFVIGWNRSLLLVRKRQHGSIKTDWDDFNKQIQSSSVFIFAFLFRNKLSDPSGLFSRNPQVFLESYQLDQSRDNSTVVKPLCARALLQTLLWITRMLLMHDPFRCTCG